VLRQNDTWMSCQTLVSVTGHARKLQGWIEIWYGKGNWVREGVTWMTQLTSREESCRRRHWHPDMTADVRRPVELTITPIHLSPISITIYFIYFNFSFLLHYIFILSLQIHNFKNNFYFFFVFNKDESRNLQRLYYYIKVENFKFTLNKNKIKRKRKVLHIISIFKCLFLLFVIIINETICNI
jgi:hypothetical protein